eukprot:46611_1
MDHPAITIIDQTIKHFTVNEDEIRIGWKEGSLCEIYSKSNNKWFPGLIVRVNTDEKEESLQVRYKDGREHRKRFENKNIRPLMHNTAEDNADQITEMKQRYGLKEGSFYEIYHEQEQKWYKAMIKRVFTDDRG